MKYLFGIQIDVLQHQMHSKETNISSSFMGIDLDPATLNTTVYYIPLKYSLYFPGMLNGDPEALAGPERMAWLVQDTEIYNQTEIQDIGRCLPTKVRNDFSYWYIPLAIYGDHH
jgi:hypothetical protein